MNSNNPTNLRLRNKPIPRQTPMAMFYWHEVADELDALLNDLPDWARSSPAPNLSEIEWAEFMESLIHCFGSLPPKRGSDIGSIAHAIDGEDPRYVGALGARVHVVSDAVSELMESHQARHSEQVIFLLPISFSERLRMLVGEGLLPSVQVTQYDLAFDSCDLLR